MSSLTNKHLPSDIDSLTRKDLVELYYIHADEFRKLTKKSPRYPPTRERKEE